MLLICSNALVLVSEARAARVPPRLVLAVAYTESRCQSDAVSTLGARGIMQVMPFWTKNRVMARRCRGTNLFDARIGACFGARILRHYFSRSHSWRVALQRYNGSSGPRYFNEVRRSLQRVYISQGWPQ